MTPDDTTYQRILNTILIHPPVRLASEAELSSAPSLRSWDSVFTRSVSYRWLNDETTIRYTTITARYCLYLTSLKTQLVARGIDYDSYRAGTTGNINLHELKQRYRVLAESPAPVIHEYDFPHYQLRIQQQLAFGHRQPFHYSRYYTITDKDEDRFRYFMDAVFIPLLSPSNTTITAADMRLSYDQIFAGNVGFPPTAKRPQQDEGLRPRKKARFE